MGFLSQKTETHIYLIMHFCSGGDLSLYIKKRGKLPTLELPGGRPGEYYPHPKEGGLAEEVIRSFLGQLGESE